jgi:hypothetical protein
MYPSLLQGFLRVHACKHPDLKLGEKSQRRSTKSCRQTQTQHTELLLETIRAWEVWTPMPNPKWTSELEPEPRPKPKSEDV